MIPSYKNFLPALEDKLLLLATLMKQPKVQDKNYFLFGTILVLLVYSSQLHHVMNVVFVLDYMQHRKSMTFQVLTQYVTIQSVC